MSGTPNRPHRCRGGSRAVLFAIVLLAIAACGDDPVSPGSSAGAEVAGWKTWVLPTADALRPPAPPTSGSAAEASELDEIVRLQSSRTPATDSIVRAWSGDPGAPWSRMAVDRLNFYWPLLPDVRIATPVRAARIMTLLHVAMYDAIAATWDAKYAYNRSPPVRASSRIRALTSVDGTPSYPSEHAAVAGAAAEILAYAFPIDVVA